MHVKVTFVSSDQSEALLKALTDGGHTESFAVDLETNKVGEDSGVELYLTMEKSLYRVIQDVIKKSKNLFKHVAVEMQDAQTFKAAL